MSATNTIAIRAGAAGNDWIQTFTGKKFFPLAPDPASIDIRDIAHALANECRFSGHCKEFYSVAQHSVLMSWLMQGSLTLQLYALLHDAAEAYLRDIPRPIKHRPEFAFYRSAEKNLQSLIYQQFGLDPMEPAGIKTADHWMLCAESNSPAIMSPVHKDWDPANSANPFVTIRPMTPALAESAFLARFNHLYHGGVDV